MPITHGFDPTSATAVPLIYCLIPELQNPEAHPTLSPSSLSQSGHFTEVLAANADLSTQGLLRGISWLEMVMRTDQPRVTDIILPSRTYAVRARVRYLGAGTFDGQR